MYSITFYIPISTGARALLFFICVCKNLYLEWMLFLFLRIKKLFQLREGSLCAVVNWLQLSFSLWFAMHSNKNKPDWAFNLSTVLWAWHTHSAPFLTANFASKACAKIQFFEASTCACGERTHSFPSRNMCIAWSLDVQNYFFLTWWLQIIILDFGASQFVRSFFSDNMYSVWGRWSLSCVTINDKTRSFECVNFCCAILILRASYQCRCVYCNDFTWKLLLCI
jgi:hypothetical protein